MQAEQPVRPKSPLRSIENAAAYVALGALAVLPIAQSLFRSIFDIHIAGLPSFINHLLLVAAMLSGIVTTRERDHLSIGIVGFSANEKLKTAATVISCAISSYVAALLAFCSVSFIRLALFPTVMIGPVPDWVFALVLPAGFAVIALRFARQTPLRGSKRFWAFLPIIIAAVFAAPQIFKAIYKLALPGFAWQITSLIHQICLVIKLPAILLLLFAAAVGTPLWTVIGGISMLLIETSGGTIDITANQIYFGMTQNNTVAIPLFTLAGFFLTESRAGERLVLAFRSLFGWMPGGLIVVSVVICAFFTSFTGASGVTILALGGILFTVLSGSGLEGDGPTSDGQKANGLQAIGGSQKLRGTGKYSPTFTIGLLTASGSIGLLFPPSLPILLVGAATRTNTVHLFLGGITPGLIMIIAMVILGLFLTRKTPVPTEKFSARNAAKAVKTAGLEILLPFILLVGYFSGALSLVEVGAAAAVYAFIVEVLIFRDIKFRDIGKVFAEAVPVIGGILIILALAQALSYYIVDTRAPENIAHWMSAVITSKYLFLFILNIALLVTGCLVDIFSAILVILPLLVPLGAAYGIDPVHLAIIFLVNMEAGYLTPPMGLNLFLASYRFRKPFMQTAKSILPFLIVQLIVVLLVTYIPALSTWIVKLL